MHTTGWLDSLALDIRYRAGIWDLGFGIWDDICYTTGHRA